jgi:hypothetical protein
MSTPRLSAPHTVAEAHVLRRAIQASDAGKYAAFWADFWLSDEVAQDHGADRRWLEDLGRSFEDALRAPRLSREDRLRRLARRLHGQERSGPNKRAATFFLQVIGYALALASDERYRPSPESKQAQAFDMAVRLIRHIRDHARAAGYEPDLAAVDLMVVAETVAWEILRGEGISVTDVLTAIKEYTAVLPLEEWIDPPALH